ncbi:MAG TPA: hypothetical protein VEF76_13185 [Patescibacteria group bacterium]|nr:hypothetical protein [Patescibacteria group bacterium]
MRAVSLIAFFSASTPLLAGTPNFDAEIVSSPRLLSYAQLEKTTLLAEKGDYLAQIKLCEYYPSSPYAEGYWSDAEYETGKKWCLLASEHGDAASQFKLALIYSSDLENKDFASAYFWGKIGAKSDLERRFVGSIKKQLTVQKLEEMDKAVELWIKKN